MPSNPKAAPRHTIHQHRHHFGWDNANPPALRVAPGETVAFETVDASGGQLSPASTVADVAALDFGKVNPVTGPVYIDGAAPGDALKVTLESFAPSGWGWTANIPGFGLLADQFPEPALHLWKYDPGDHGARHVRPRRPGAAQAVHRRDRLRARRARAAQHRAAALGRRQHGHPRPRGRHRPLPAGRGAGGPVLGRRLPRRPGRRRGLRHRDREPDGGDALVRPGQGRQPQVAAPDHARARRAATSTSRATRSRPGSTPTCSRARRMPSAR